MGKDSGIQWTTHTFNPWRGCTRVSEGCKFCYAELLSKRNPAVLGIWGPNGTRVVAADSQWRSVLGWNQEARKAKERHRVFTASLSDVFEDWQGPMLNSQGKQLWIEPKDPQELFRICENKDGSFLPHECFFPISMGDVRRRLAKLISSTPYLDYLLLTKRIENANDMLYEMWFADVHWPKNIWLGTTVEDRKAKARIDLLRESLAPIKFLSIEPLIEDLGDLDLRGIDWVIVGGESGSKARPFDISWARSIRDQCRAFGVAFFMKQVGSNPGITNYPLASVATHASWKPDDSHGGDITEWPEDIRIRQFPLANYAHF